ncbi:hypothetical protein QBC35DRAFT_461867 [Podospora australis]|uniref:Fe2OG dioxygenase domain-containing protein n=1 Tax=Podospora australis TaxID=1536484 RepID=A0AAN6WWU9_9PEZI|nr:hypothetical protein QBC35DRAFT_461867 [Podospora australis]
MPPTFTINPAAIPAIRTRKALLVIDLQNDFLAPDGALPVTEPEGFVKRTLELVKEFRDAEAGDVVWVRSEFECHRSLSAEGEQIVTANIPIRPQRPGARGRPPTSREHDGAVVEADEEAFLSLGADNAEKGCAKKGTKGAEFAPEVQETIDRTRDIVFTKTHYSAFASSQQELVQKLRGRFVTEMYVCGALTNVSIYATALDAGRHGYGMTVVEDCCGFRNQIRHFNAVRQLVQLTGSEVANADTVIEQLQPPEGQPSHTSGLSPFISSIQLNLGRGGPPGIPPRLRPAPGPAAREPAPPEQDRRITGAAVPPPASPHPKSASPQKPFAVIEPDTPSLRPSNDNFTPLEVDSDTEPESESPARSRTPEKTSEVLRRGSAQASPPNQLELVESPKGPPSRAPGATTTTTTSSSKPDNPSRIRVQARLRLRHHSSSDKSSSSPPSSPPKLKPTTTPPIAEDRRLPAKRIKISEPSPTKLPSDPAPTPTPLISTLAPANIITPDPDYCKSVPKPPTMEQTQQESNVSEPLCEGDTHVITNVLPPDLASDAFDRLLEEVSWAGMSHMGGEVPRRIAVQGAVEEDATMPVYRHPADESPPLLPFSPTVTQIKNAVEKHLGHPLNHVLIQHYRSGNDYISEHSDKTLDVVKGSFICNVSLGAERTMVFRTKRPPKPKDSQPENESVGSDTEKAKRQVQRAPLPHNSLIRMGLSTNARWLHAIRQDKRSDREKSAAELVYNGARISLTFRQIGTFIDGSQSRIWGQGAVAKTREDAQPVVNGQTPEAVRLLQAFGTENHSSEFDWAANYGSGFNVLHMGVPKRFCAGSDVIANARVGMALAELGVSTAKGSVEGDVRFEDNDTVRAVVDGHETVLRYLDAVYGAGRRYDQLLPSEIAKRFSLLQRALDFVEVWRGVLKAVDAKEPPGLMKTKKALTLLLFEELSFWEGCAREGFTSAATTQGSSSGEKEDSKGEQEKEASGGTGGTFYLCGGSKASPVDFALWPVLHDMVRVLGESVFTVSFLRPPEGKGEETGQVFLRKYYEGFKGRSSVECVVKIFDSAAT